MRAVYIDSGTDIWDVLRRAAMPRQRDWIGVGNDYRNKQLFDHNGGRRYHMLTVRAAWRVENPVQFRKYDAEREKMQADLKERGLQVPSVCVQKELAEASSKLPGELLRDLNEAFLLHGTDPASMHDILQDGFNECLASRGYLGFGTYFAEDSGKCDQYLGKPDAA